jgi:hypothetical protein
MQESNEMAKVKKFLYMIEGKDTCLDSANFGEVFTVFEPELPAVSFETAQFLCDKWHAMHPEIAFKVVMYMKPEWC